jgi:hypothetical protein
MPLLDRRMMHLRSRLQEKSIESIGSPMFCSLLCVPGHTIGTFLHIGENNTDHTPEGPDAAPVVRNWDAVGRLWWEICAFGSLEDDIPHSDRILLDPFSKLGVGHPKITEFPYIFGYTRRKDEHILGVQAKIKTDKTSLSLWTSLSLQFGV